MRVITKGRLQEFWEAHQQAKKPLSEWFAVVAKAKWNSFEDLRVIYPSADQVKVESGSITTIFNISGNKYRLITAIHYNTQKVFIIDIMTHADYDKNVWKKKF